MKRIVIGGMSHGSLSPETKAALTLAARTLGIRINSGEGGIPQNWRGTILQETDFQSASGRFGNTTDNMVAVEPNRYIQKKYAQGAKPGKGGHLPGKKVNPFIAKNRGVVPGTGLISSSQNHSGYSVEDETTEHRRYKEVNPYARTSGKLASKEGIGNIAVGLAKATVDDIVVCGWDGGTGAAKKPDMKNTGLDLEPGLAETNQALTENRFRTKKSITAASGIRPIGWDAAKLHILGADYLEIGLAALQSLGCLVLKLCHTNTCKVGIATQDPKLRTRFEGDAQHVINLLMFWANDIRPILAKLGREKIDDIIGHTNLLKMSDKKYLVPWSNYGEPGKSPYVSFSELGFDFEALLAPPDPNGGPPQHCELQSGERAEYENPDNPDRAISIDRAYLEKNAEKYKKHMSCWQPGDAPLIITTKAYTFNHDIGIRLSGVNARQFNDKVSGPEMPVHIMSKGQTGQSTGAYGKGVRIEHEGVLNDYVGLSSTNCEIIAYPIKNSPIHFNTQNNVILGNVCYYGANGGKLRAAGGTGNRFALSNLGGNFVVEFVQDNGCNLMAAGKGLILGEVGPDFAAGYTGGDIVVFDKAGTLHKRVHKKSVELIPVRFGTLAEQWALESLKDHVKETGSLYAQGLLREWAQIINSGKMVNVRPKTKPYYDPDWENQPEIIEFLQTQQKLIMRPFI